MSLEDLLVVVEEVEEEGEEVGLMIEDRLQEGGLTLEEHRITVIETTMGDVVVDEEEGAGIEADEEAGIEVDAVVAEEGVATTINPVAPEIQDGEGEVEVHQDHHLPVDAPRLLEDNAGGPLRAPGRRHLEEVEVEGGEGHHRPVRGLGPRLCVEVLRLLLGDVDKPARRLGGVLPRPCHVRGVVLRQPRDSVKGHLRSMNLVVVVRAVEEQAARDRLGTAVHHLLVVVVLLLLELDLGPGRPQLWTMM
jgi:hypothetical protein